MKSYVYGALLNAKQLNRLASPSLAFTILAPPVLHSCADKVINILNKVMSLFSKCVITVDKTLTNYIWDSDLCQYKSQSKVLTLVNVLSVVKVLQNAVFKQVDSNKQSLLLKIQK